MQKNINKSKTYKLAPWAALVAVSLAHAQAPDAGSILREQTQQRPQLPTKPLPELRIEQPARPAMKPSTARFVLKSVRFSGNTVYSQTDLMALVQHQVGKEIGYTDLDTLAARISKHYRDNGYMIARAYLPAQDIKDGNIEIAVIEGRFSKVNIDNKSRVRTGIIDNHVGGLKGLIAYSPQVERKLLLLDDLAGVAEARALLKPGAGFGESEITYEIAGTPLITGILEAENHGNRFTGQNRVSAYMYINSPLGLGDQFNLRATKGFDGLELGRAAYTIPIGADGFKLAAAYTTLRYKINPLGTTLPAGTAGDSDTYTLTASYPIIRTRNFNLYANAAYDWRDFQDRIISAATIIDKKTRAFTGTLTGDLRDSLLGGGLNLYSFAYTNGSVNIQSPVQLAIDAATARTNGTFDKWNLHLVRSQAITQNTSIYLAYSGQKGGKNLDSSEKFILGGANGVRAYPQGEGTGDSGYVANLEFRYNYTTRWLPGSLMPFVFADAGEVYLNENPFAATPNKRHLAGGGFGLNWSRSQDFMLKLTLASRIGKQTSTASDTDRHTRGWVHLMKYF